jgi:molybdopterin converting factor small subunit
MPNIKIPTPLRPYTGNQSQVSVTGVTVGDALTDLVSQYPDLRTHLFNGDDLRSFVNIFLGNEDTRFLDGLNTDVEPDDQLRIVPTIAGG